MINLNIQIFYYNCHVLHNNIFYSFIQRMQNAVVLNKNLQLQFRKKQITQKYEHTNVLQTSKLV